MLATSVKECISPNNLVPFNFSPHVLSIFPNLSCLVFKPYFFSLLPYNVIFYTRCFAHDKAVRSVTCSNCTVVAEMDQKSLSFCSGSDGGESSCNFRRWIALILIALPLFVCLLSGRSCIYLTGLFWRISALKCATSLVKYCLMCLLGACTALGYFFVRLRSAAKQQCFFWDHAEHTIGVVLSQQVCTLLCWVATSVPAHPGRYSHLLLTDRKINTYAFFLSFRSWRSCETALYAS